MQKKLLLGLIASGLLGLSSSHAQAQASLTTSPYTQDFNTLANTGTSTALPSGWALLETNTGTGTGANNSYAADNGAANSGNTYSYGATGSTNRAFGTLLSASLAPTIGAQFTNNSGSTITSLTVNYTGQTWRIGGTARQDKLTFAYSTDATSLGTGTWTAQTALDYANNSATAAVTSGVSTPIQTTAVTGTITGLNLLPGQSIWFRWVDFNAAGSDDGTAIDDFSLSWQAPPASAPDLTINPATLSFPSQNIGTSSAAQTYQLSAANLTGDVTVTTTGPFTVSKDGTTYATSLTLTPAELAAARTMSVKFTPTAQGAASGSVVHTSPGAATRTVVLDGNGLDPNQLTFDFQACTGGSTISDGWTQYSVTGAQTWACTTFGRDPQNPAGTAAFPNGVQINGFANSASNLNEDWLISPALNLSGTTFPLLSFWSRVAFNGPPLKLLVSTNYPGTGSPNATGVTWTDLNAAFPATGTAAWTQTTNVDLSAYKQAGVYVAFVYNSTTEEAARWTLDDVVVTNSPTAPPPAFTASVPSLAFGYRAVASTSTLNFNLTASNLTGDVTITSSDAAFQVSANGSGFGSSATLTAAAASGNTLPITVRFAPTQASRNYAATLTIRSNGAPTQTVTVSGNTYDVATTLEVVNWNVEWFGSPTLGPSDDNQQYSNVRTILNSLNADVFALAEIVDTVRLNTLVAQMPGYAYRVSDFGSFADNRQDPDYAGAQKLAFVYRTSVVSNPRFTSFFRCTQAQNCPEYSYWSSGRFPYVMTADVTLNGVTKPVTFVLIHAKANTSPTQTSYDRRKAAADGLKAKLDAEYPTANVVILGDFNDDLDQTVAAGISTTTTSYVSFISAPADYTALTLPLSQAGQKSTVSYNDVIDHVVVTNDLNQYYVPGSAEIQSQVAGLVASYGSSTSDHYPVLTRYNFPALPDLVVSTAQRISGSYNNVTITSTGNALLNGPLSVEGQLVVQSGGSLATGCQPITGTGSFTLAAGAKLDVCSPAGISLTGATGDVQVTGTRRFSPGAEYTYNGPAAQVTGAGLPTRVYKLTASGTGNLTLSQPLAVRGLLTLGGPGGNLLLNNQPLTLLSDADTTANVMSYGGATVNGPVTVQRYIGRSVNPGLGYRHLSAPVANTTVADLATSNFSPVVNPAYNAAATPGTVTPFPTVFGYDEARLNTSPATGLSAFDKGWFSPAATTAAMVVGRGYTVNLAGGQTVDFVGTLNNDDVTLTLPRTNATDGGWHLLGNPYPSALDWSYVTIPAGLDAAMYTFQSTSQYGGFYRSYTNGVGNPLLGLGQGFFVRTSQGSTSTTLTLFNNTRVASVRTDAAPLNRGTAETRPLVQLALRNAAGLADDAYVYFQTGATTGYDATYDAYKLNNPSGLDLASVAAGTELSINGLPLTTSATVVPLNLRVPQAGAYTLQAAQLLNFPAADVYLVDAQTGQRINLAQQPSYAFSTAVLTTTGRFTLEFAPRNVTAAHQSVLAAGTNLYPNPARNRCVVQVPAVAGVRTVEAVVFNALGQPVRRQQVAHSTSGSALTLELAGLPAGVYSVRVQAGADAVTKRLVVE